MKQAIKNIFPYGLVDRILLYRDFVRLGFPKISALQSALSPNKSSVLRETRLNFLPDNSIDKLHYVVDVGANEGFWSLGVLSLCQPKKLIAIEPYPELQSILKSRLSSFSNVSILNMAAGIEKGTVDLHVTSHSHNISILKPKAEMNTFYSSGWDLKKKVSVPVNTLDSILSELTEVSLLKIDVQGYERFVLEGAKKTLEKTKFVILEVTFFSHYEGDTNFPDLHNMMTDAGFYLQNIVTSIRKGGRSPWGDAIYISGSLT